MSENVLLEGRVYVMFGRWKARQRKKTWGVLIEFCDNSHEMEHGLREWGAAMNSARALARKYGFRIVDIGDPYAGGGAS